MGVKPRLGEILMEAGFITSAQLEVALWVHSRSDKRVGQVLVEKGFITPLRLTQALSRQLTLPWVSLDHVDFDDELLDWVPKEVARRLRAVPVYVRRTDGQPPTLYVATDDPTNDALVRECAALSRAAVRLMVASPDDIDGALDRYFSRTLAPPAPSPPKRTLSGAIMIAAQTAEPVRAPSDRPGGPDSDVTVLALEGVESIEVDASAAELDGGPSEMPAEDPVILVVHAPTDLVRRCREVAVSVGARVEETDLMMAGSDASEHRPLMLVVPEDVYAFDRVGFSKLAMKTRAHLLIWSEDIDADYLEPLVGAARIGRPGPSAAPAARESSPAPSRETAPARPAVASTRETAPARPAVASSRETAPARSAVASTRETAPARPAVASTRETAPALSRRGGRRGRRTKSR